MILLKIATIFLLALSVRGEKKIELQDIEEDNLKSEKENEDIKTDNRPQFSGTASLSGLSLDLLKNDLLRYISQQPSAHQSQQQRFVHQYAVSETPERISSASPVQYTPPTGHQQAMVGYLSNIPMQVYLIPHYYTDHSRQKLPHANQQLPHANPQYQTVSSVPNYQTTPEAIHTQHTNYVEVPAYVPSTAKTYLQQFTAPITFVGLPAQPTIPPPQTTSAPVVAYQIPFIEYTTAATRPYYTSTQYSENNSYDEVPGHEDGQQQYSTPADVSFQKPIAEYPRHYNSRVPIRDDYKPIHSNSITELPHPNPVLLRGGPSHLAHVPKTLPTLYRPSTKPVYHGGASQVSSAYTTHPHEVYGPPYKRRPTSLLDSYIPSNVQIEYLKKGLIKEPAAVYEALSTGRFPHLTPRHYERGFLPNQAYHTGAGGVTFGHYKNNYKRTPKVDKVQ